MSEQIPARVEGGGLADILLSHLDSAYNLARWLVRNAEDAEDVVQDAYLRALKYSGRFREGDARAWLLTIVRNTSYGWLRRTRAHGPAIQFDEEVHTCGATISTPEELLLRNASGHLVEKTLSELPVRFREILALRELEGLSYKEIATVMGVPIGTVMSTLSRAREGFRRAVLRPQEVCAPHKRGAQVPGERHDSCRPGERASVHEQQSARLDVARR